MSDKILSGSLIWLPELKCEYIAHQNNFYSLHIFIYFILINIHLCKYLNTRKIIIPTVYFLWDATYSESQQNVFLQIEMLIHEWKRKIANLIHKTKLNRSLNRKPVSWLCINVSSRWAIPKNPFDSGYHTTIMWIGNGVATTVTIWWSKVCFIQIFPCFTWLMWVIIGKLYAVIACKVSVKLDGVGEGKYHWKYQRVELSLMMSTKNNPILLLRPL